jgi:exopolysaccharide biosynthesis polyprenyl glycosylphosphotransferase
MAGVVLSSELYDRAARGYAQTPRRAHGRFWRDSYRRRLLALSDVIAVCAASLLLVAWSGNTGAALETVAFLPGWGIVAKLCGLYDRDHRSLRSLTIDELPRILMWALGGSAALTVVLLAVDGHPIHASDRVRLWALLVVLAATLRTGTRAAWRALVPSERTLVVGEGALADHARRKLELFPDIHATVVRECSEEALILDPSLLDGIDRVIVACPTLDEELLEQLLAAARQYQVKLSVVPPVRGMLGTAVQLSRIADLPLVEYHTWDSSRTTMLGKRLLDVGAASLGLVLLSPLLLVVALALRLSGSGPALFVQERAGRGGKPFRMLKFRTMIADAEQRLPEFVDLATLEEPFFKLHDDPRVTFLGRLLRRTSIDELPQLVNVLRGEMSLVGPRPEQVELVGRYRPEHRFRLTVKPGLTGPMQIYGRGELTFEERLAVERDYIENVSVGRDIRIIALTVGAVLRLRGAY